jgi:ligand-binding sensor domain-containing protein
VLTAGHGPFLGSQRRKELASVWFGLYDSAVTAIHSDGKMVWFGSRPAEGAVVGANVDLTGWRVLPAQQEYSFPTGAVNDILTWKGFVWFATDQGVVRYDPVAATRKFQHYRRMLGSTDMRVIRLFVHGDKLYAGSERGIASLDDPALQFKGNPLPISATPAINDFCENGGDKGGDLWAATDLGLLVLRPSGWRTFGDVTLDDVPEGTGVRVTTVAFHDSSLYWAGGDRVYVKPRRREARTLFTQDGVIRLALDGDVLYAAHGTGVRAYNLKSRQWTDFKLEDGIPGTKVQSVMVRDGFLWVGTDYGVTRIRVRPYLP